MKKHLSIKVKGRVQGVFFRASAADVAEQLGLNGFVKNESDGSVYIEAEGDEPTLQKFVTWTRTGPPRAKVEECIVAEGEVRNFSGFKIKR